MSEGQQIRVGIGGWVFPPWRGVFYPPGLPQAQELHFASRALTTIEINGTFYGAQKPTSFRHWHDESPEDFIFSVKGPRFVTHRPDLDGAGPTLDRFFSSGVLELRDKLGPILWQFPPSAPADESAFAAFIEMLPNSIDGRSLRHVVELRRPKIRTDRAIDLISPTPVRSSTAFWRAGFWNCATSSGRSCGNFLGCRRTKAPSARF